MLSSPVRFLAVALLLALLGGCASTQTRVVETKPGMLIGTVYDAETREPVPGATVAIGGTQLGTVTDIDGYYFIMGLPAEATRLQASYVGYFTKQMEYDPAFTGDTLRVDWLLVEGGPSDEIVVCGSRCQ